MSTCEVCDKPITASWPVQGLYQPRPDAGMPICLLCQEAEPHSEWWAERRERMADPTPLLREYLSEDLELLGRLREETT